MELSNKRVMVVGLGVSGLAAARFLASRGAKLVMTDRRVDIERGKLPAGAVKLGAEDASWLDGIDLVVTSPGVPRDSILLRAATERRIPIIGEIELASRFIDAPIAAVTGTNGKSTVVVLLGEILKASGRRTFVGGNLGTPLIDAVGGKWDVAVVEVSSFQLEWIEKFRPQRGRASQSERRSLRSLQRSRRLRQREGAAVRKSASFGLRDSESRRSECMEARAERALARDRLWVCSRRIRGVDLVRRTANAIVFDFDDNAMRGRIGLEGFRLRGRHNISNAMAATAAALALGVKAEANRARARVVSRPAASD